MKIDNVVKHIKLMNMNILDARYTDSEKLKFSIYYIQKGINRSYY